MLIKNSFELTKYWSSTDKPKGKKLLGFTLGSGSKTEEESKYSAQVEVWRELTDEAFTVHKFQFHTGFH